MKVLIDENLPVKLKHRLSHKGEIFTVADLRWNSIENGELLERMEEEGFHYLITADRNIPHQQSIESFQIKIIIVKAHDNRYETILTLLDKIEEALSKTEKVIIVS